MSFAHNPLRVSDAELRLFVLEASTVLMQRRTISALHSFYRYALDEGLLMHDPSRNLYVRTLAADTNEDLLKALALSRDVTWGGILTAATRGPAARWRGKAGAEILRRALARLRRCRTGNDVLAVLTAPVLGEPSTACSSR